MKTTVGVLAFSCAIFWGSAAGAQTGLVGATRLDYERDPTTLADCPDEETFRNLVAAHLEGGEDPFTEDGTSTMQVRLTKEEEGFVGVAKLLDPAGENMGEKRRSGGDCKLLSRGIALVVSMALVRVPKRRPTVPPPMPPRSAKEPRGEISGLEIDVSGGYAVGVGNVDGLDLPHRSFGTVLVGLDIGHRVNETFFIGLYGRYGYGVINPDAGPLCEYNPICSLSVYRAGLSVQLHTNPRDTADPWFGLGLGYEVHDFSVKGTLPLGNGAASVDAEDLLHGPELLQAQFGVDFAAGPLRISPYLGASVGLYVARQARSFAFTSTGYAKAGSIDSIQSVLPHTWAGLGVRVGLVQ